MSFCPDKPILAGCLGSFAQYSLSALAGHYDDEGVISLRQRVVNVMQSECRVRLIKGTIVRQPKACFVPLLVLIIQGYRYLRHIENGGLLTGGGWCDATPLNI